jgi:hypothetical protein
LVFGIPSKVKQKTKKRKKWRAGRTKDGDGG